MHPRITLSTGNFFFAIASTLVIYILLPYLGQFMPQADASLVVTVGATLALVLFLYLPHLVERFGAQPLAIAFGIAQMFLLFALAASPSAIGIIILVVLLIASQPLLSYMLDILLEATVAEEGTTGRVRTLFLTAYNVAELGAPLLMGSLLANTDAYPRVFLAAAAASVPFIILFAARKLPAGRPPKHVRFLDALRAILKSRDLTAVGAAHLLLYLFYVWAPLYVPVYLHDVLGMPWGELGWIFSLMLLPFVLIEYPAGWVADNLIGDKELMVAGFFIMGGTFTALGFVTGTASVALIAGVLFATRVGAALVESMTEAHFFRRVSEEDTEEIAAFRMLWPLAGLIGPLVGAGLLFVDGFYWLFITTGGFILLGGVIAALSIRDFR